MTDQIHRISTPEEQHLAEQEALLSALSEELASAEERFATAGAEFARFRDGYARRFVPLYAELDRLEAEVARLVASSEGSAAAHRRAAEAAGRAEESQRAEQEVADEGAKSAVEPPVVVSDDLKGLYRQAAKRLHPDLAGDDGERVRRTGLMAALNAAYAAGDIDAVRRVLEAEAARPEAVSGDDIGSRLVRVLRRIAQARRRLAELASLSGDLAADPMFALFEQCRGRWARGEDALADDEADLRQQIASARARLAALELERRGRGVAP